MLIHPSAKIMIAFCCWESSPNHVGHAPPEKSVSACFILILSLSISASWYSICLYKWALGISINKRRMGRCVHVYTQTPVLSFFLTDASPLPPSAFNTVVKFFLKNLPEHKKSMQEIRFNSFHTVICLTASRQNTAASNNTWQGLRGLCPAANPPTLPWLLLLAWLCYTKKLCWSFGRVWLNMIQHNMHSVNISFVSLKCGWITLKKSL